MATVDFAVITPLPEEWHAMKAHLGDVEEPPSTFPTAVGTIGQYRVVLRMPPETGEATTADITRQVVSEWNPTWLALVGVAGGFSGKGVGLGDVVVASKIYPYDFGKIHTANGDRPNRFERRDRIDVHVDPSWLSFAKMLADPSSQRSSNWTAGIKLTRRPDRGQRRRSKVHVGPVASGDKVVDDPTYQFFAEARESFPDLFAIEMEGAGAGASVRNLQAERRIGLLMIRGISDVPRAEEAEGEQPRGTAQRDSWKPYAAAAAAAFFEYLLSRPGGSPPQATLDSTRSVVETPRHTEDASDTDVSPRPQGMPSPPTSFVGRAHDVAIASALLSQENTRILTLTGPGGVGKTRLALEVAREVGGGLTDGMVFVDLSSLSDPEQVPTAVMHALSLTTDPSQTTGGSSPYLFGWQESLARSRQLRAS